MQVSGPVSVPSPSAPCELRPRRRRGRRSPGSSGSVTPVSASRNGRRSDARRKRDRDRDVAEGGARPLAEVAQPVTPPGVNVPVRAKRVGVEGRSGDRRRGDVRGKRDLDRDVAVGRGAVSELAARIQDSCVEVPLRADGVTRRRFLVGASGRDGRWRDAGWGQTFTGVVEQGTDGPDWPGPSRGHASGPVSVPSPGSPSHWIPRIQSPSEPMASASKGPAATAVGVTPAGRETTTEELLVAGSWLPGPRLAVGVIPGALQVPVGADGVEGPGAGTDRRNSLRAPEAATLGLAGPLRRSPRWHRSQPPAGARSLQQSRPPRRTRTAAPPRRANHVIGRAITAPPSRRQRLERRSLPTTLLAPRRSYRRRSFPRWSFESSSFKRSQSGGRAERVEHDSSTTPRPGGLDQMPSY